ncbi:MAG: UPF0175 family protein [Deltaproteobacteria bacterium]|nr:UPF0175 family protein [Deltaproteobacteria bacterium]
MATVSLQIEDDLLQGKDPKEQQRAIREALFLYGYTDGKLSIGILTKALGLGFDETKKWLEDRNIPLLRKLPPELEKTVQKNMQDLVAGKFKHLNFNPGENQQLLMEGEVCFQEKMKDPEFRKAMGEDEIRPEIEKEPRQAIKERLIIHAYVQGDISMGATAEILGLHYEDALHWIGGQGIYTWRRLPPELEEITNQNMRKLAVKLGITIP